MRSSEISQKSNICDIFSILCFSHLNGYILLKTQYKLDQRCQSCDFLNGFQSNKKQEIHTFICCISKSISLARLQHSMLVKLGGGDDAVDWNRHCKRKLSNPYPISNATNVINVYYTSTLLMSILFLVVGFNKWHN